MYIQHTTLFLSLELQIRIRWDPEFSLDPDLDPELLLNPDQSQRWKIFHSLKQNIY